jgi:hypothetical protein
MEELAQVLLILTLIALALAYARGGWGEVGSWVKAKLIGA